ncbi:MAG: Fic family protein [Bacteroidales bacterium]|jgi:Fic family protein|nr:Fic family protein [Bacteroidales bacterium]
MAKYIYQYASWPNFTWDEKEVQNLLGKLRHLQGRIYGQISTLGFTVKEETILSTLTLDVVKSSEIEGEILNPEHVRSSIAKRLGIEHVGVENTRRDVEGVVEMLLDATQKFNNEITEERLFGWHSCLFPTGWSGMTQIDVAKYRTGGMQIVSGAMGMEKVHYEAPKSENVKSEMDKLIVWLNTEAKLDLVVKSAIAHFWFIIIHPFDDGNGRISRALSDLLLARSENSPLRFYSLSNQLLEEKKQYYSTLQKVQYSSGDITEWIIWYLECLYNAIKSADLKVQNILQKALFWNKHEKTAINSRQRLMINRLFDGFEGKLKSSKWAKMTKCSKDTALRDIKDLIDKEILKQDDSGGRSTNYELVLD